MSMVEVLDTLGRWCAQGQTAAVATLVHVRRSAPRPPGARLALSSAGEVVGSISSGCVESDLVERLREVIADGRARRTEYGITDEMAAGVGLPCGGQLDVLLAIHEPTDPVWGRLTERIEAGAPAVLLLMLEGDHAGRPFLLDPDLGPIDAGVSAVLEEGPRASIAGLFDHGGTALLDLPHGPAFAEAYLPPPRLAIVGASPIAEALCHLATWSAFEVTVIDPRRALATAARFPDAVHVLNEWPEEGLRRLGLDRWLSVVVLAHDEKLDVPALAAALRGGCRYVGLLGGRRTQRSRREALAQLGLGAESLRRLHGPVGLRLGARGPREIALSIMAQLIADQRGALPPES